MGNFMSIIYAKLILFYLFNVNIGIANSVVQSSFVFNSQPASYFPYRSNFSLSMKNADVKKVVIVIHGVLKNANGAYNDIVYDGYPFFTFKFFLIF